MKLTGQDFLAKFLQSDIGQKFGQIAKARGIDGNEIAKLVQEAQSQRKAERLASRSDDAAQVEISNPPADVPSETPEATDEVSIQPIDESSSPIDVAPVEKPQNDESDSVSLARQYVELYEKNTGKDLSAEEEKELENNINDFYVNNNSRPDGEERLETLVRNLEQQA